MSIKGIAFSFYFGKTKAVCDAIMAVQPEECCGDPQTPEQLILEKPLKTPES